MIKFTEISVIAAKSKLQEKNDLGNCGPIDSSRAMYSHCLIHKTFHSKKHLYVLIGMSLALLKGLVADTMTDDLPLRPESQLPELNAILEAASGNAPGLVSQELLRQEANSRLKQAKSDYYPSIDAYGEIGYRKDYRQDAEDTDNFGLGSNIRLRRPLYHWGAIEAKIQRARIQNDTSTIDFWHANQQIQRRIRSDYLTLLLNKVSLRAEQFRSSTLKEELEANRVQFESGKLSPLEFESLQLGYEDAALKIRKIEREQQNIESGFTLNAGWDQPITLNQQIGKIDSQQVEDWINEQSQSLDGSWTEKSHAVATLRNAIDNELEQLKIINSKQRPLVNFTAYARQGQSNTATRNNVDTISLFAGVSASWNIFDGFLTKHQRIESTLRKRRLENSLRNVTGELRLEARKMLDDIRFLKNNNALLERRFALESSKFEVTQSDADAGRISKNTLDSAKSDLLDLELSLMESRAALLMGISDYHDFTQPIRPHSR